MGKLTDLIESVRVLATANHKKLSNIRGTGVVNAPDHVLINPPQWAAPAPGGRSKAGWKRVDLVVFDGTGGDRTHKPTFRYTAFAPGTTTNPIATLLSPWFNRNFGLHDPAAHGFLDGDVLVVCDELPTTGPCTL